MKACISEIQKNQKKNGRSSMINEREWYMQKPKMLMILHGDFYQILTKILFPKR